MSKEKIELLRRMIESAKQTQELLFKLARSDYAAGVIDGLNLALKQIDLVMGPEDEE